MLNKIPLNYLIAAFIFVAIFVFYISANTKLRKQRAVDVQQIDRRSRFAGAETWREAHSEDLIDEIRNVIDQEGMPVNVFADDRKPKERNVDDPTNIAVTLHHLFQEYYPQDPEKPNDLQKLWDASPAGAWDVDEQVLHDMHAILVKFEPKRQTVRKMLLEETTRFNYMFNQRDTKSIMSVQPAVNTEASKYLADYALLEEYAVAQALLDGNIIEATNALWYIFHLAHVASKLGNVGVRSDVALMRLQTYEVMQRVVLDPKFEKSDMVFLRDMLAERQEKWISEYDTWFGDRASGMVLYHHVMMNGVVNAFTPEELALVQNRANIDAVMRGFRAHHEEDKTFYLESMQRILNVSKKPFVKRQDVLKRIKKELSDMESTYDENGLPSEHFVAYVLLKDIDRLMQIFAQDQSALNRAVVVMHRSLGQSNTDSYHDPFTDEPYEVRKVKGMWNVSATMLPRDFQVPDFTNKE